MEILYLILDFREVYLGMSSVRGRYKIGIAKNVKHRWKDIDRKIEGSKEKPVFHARCFFAGRVERYLLNRYKNRAVKEKGWGREWRRINIFQRMYVMAVIGLNSLIGMFVFLTGMIWLITYIMNLYNIC